jgi:hypothetical protein
MSLISNKQILNKFDTIDDMEKVALALQDIAYWSYGAMAAARTKNKDRVHVTMAFIIERATLIQKILKNPDLAQSQSGVRLRVKR